MIWRNPLNSSLIFHMGVDLYVSVHVYRGMCTHYACPPVKVKPDACACVHRCVHHRCMSVSPSLVSLKSWEGADLLTMEAACVRDPTHRAYTQSRTSPLLPEPPEPRQLRTRGQCLVFCAKHSRLLCLKSHFMALSIRVDVRLHPCPMGGIAQETGRPSAF